jgi:hypothetical protein
VVADVRGTVTEPSLAMPSLSDGKVAGKSVSEQHERHEQWLVASGDDGARTLENRKVTDGMEQAGGQGDSGLAAVVVGR